MTIEIDEQALKHFMGVIGAKSKREAVNKAILLADKIAQKGKLLAETLSPEKLKHSVDPAYDLRDFRKNDVPH